MGTNQKQMRDALSKKQKGAKSKRENVHFLSAMRHIFRVVEDDDGRMGYDEGSSFLFCPIIFDLCNATPCVCPHQTYSAWVNTFCPDPDLVGRDLLGSSFEQFGNSLPVGTAGMWVYGMM